MLRPALFFYRVDAFLNKDSKQTFKNRYVEAKGVKGSIPVTFMEKYSTPENENNFKGLSHYFHGNIRYEES